MDLRQRADRDVGTGGAPLKKPRVFVVGAGDVVLHGPQHPDEGGERVDMGAGDVACE